ncbi:MAG: RecQ family ATP-dependent DNA helicase [Draconibacterium sp.]
MSTYNQILTRYWGYSDFRPLQLEIIESIAKGNDTLGLMPTGGGKSVTFQVFSLSKPGLCLVVTPLIALMKDQVESLNRKGIKALAIHSGLSKREIKLTLDNAVWGDYKFLYVSPERLGTGRFLERLEQMNINLLAVDEAHCISQWGYDFRPSYLNIADVRKILKDVPVLALTATATPQVADDIQDKLKFAQKNLLKMSFERENLSYLVRQVEDKNGYLLKTLQKVKGSGVIYVRNRKATREVADFLKKEKISSGHYHAGLSNLVRSSRQDAWLKGEIRVIVATNAFGMGIDKPDVRFVIHIDAPDSLEAYYQEAGRAGRDGKKSAAVLLFNNADRVKLKKHVVVAFPEIANIKRIYEALCNYFQVAVGYGKGMIHEFGLQNFAQAYKFQQAMVYNSLKILQREGYIEFTEEVDNPSRVSFVVSRDELYKYQVANAAFDDFIKLLLRSYTGLFNGYVTIDEELLAKRAGIDQDRVYNFLKHLRKSKVIDYVPRSQTPFIYFSKERVTIDRLKISKENYEIRKKDYAARIDSVLHYAGSTSECRSQMLLSYFGEDDSPPCGICDVCKALKQMEISAFEFKAIGKRIAKILEKPCKLDDLIFKLQGEPERMREVLRWYIDNQKIIYRVDGLLEWKRE